MRNSEYWKHRFELLSESQLAQGAEFYHELEKQYTLAAQNVEKELRNWYGRYASENKVSYSEAKRILSTKELEEFRWNVEEYIKHGKSQNPQFAKQLERASAKFHVSRLEALKLNIQQQIENVYGYELDGIDKLARDIYSNGYYHTAFEIQKGFGVGWGIGALDDNKIKKAISKPWAADGANFSERIWKDRSKLINEIHSGLTQNLIRGSSPDDLVKEISQKFNTSKYNASRLVMTESAFFASSSRLDGYKECGIEKYQVLETLDSLTCSLCGDMDGKVFSLSEYVIGLTAPPFHPNCRGTDCAYFDELEIPERAARNAAGETYYVSENMTFNEWEKSFVGLKNKPFKSFRIFPGEWEIRNDELETGILYNDDGNVILRKTGSEIRVDFDESELVHFKDKIFTHVHIKNITVSDTDIYMMYRWGIKELHAITKEGVYIITNPGKWQREFRCRDEFSTFYFKVGKDYIRELQRKLDDGVITKEQADKEVQHLIVTKLSEILDSVYTSSRQQGTPQRNASDLDGSQK